MNTFSYKNTLIAALLCLPATQALGCWSEPKKTSSSKQSKFFTFKIRSESAIASTARQDLYRARPIIAHGHIALVQNQLKSGKSASGFSKQSTIEYYADEGKGSFTLANDQVLCAQQNPQLGCPVNVVRFSLNAKDIVAVQCSLHHTYHKIEVIPSQDAA